MAKVKMSVSEALTKRKNLKKKIDKRLNEFNSVGIRTNNNDQFVNGELYSEWEKKVKSEYQSLQALTLNYDMLNSAIINSNSCTKVFIYGREMSVAEAIALKQSPMNNVMKLLFDKMDDDYVSAIIASKQLSIKALDEKNISKAVAFVKCSSKESEESIRNKIININTPIIVDPLKSEREKGFAKYEEYEDKIDAIIQKSNCDTYITVDYID